MKFKRLMPKIKHCESLNYNDKIEILINHERNNSDFRCNRSLKFLTILCKV